jgi:hypothetical protein
MSARLTADRRARILGLGIAAAVGVTLSVLNPAGAQEIAAPEDPVAKKAFEVLEKHCARCHQEGKLSARERPAKNFGFVLKLDQLASDPHYILPGNAQGSKLFKQIVDKEMPYDVIYEGAAGPDITADEVLALEAWIKSLGTKTAASCEAHKFVKSEDIVGLIAADLEKQQRSRRKGARYLTLTHLTNACTDEVAMNVYRQGAVKLINSLSRSSDVVRLETIDPDGSIIRVNLDDIGWTADDWNTVLKTYPYNTQPDTELTAIFERTTTTKMPYVRGDWFAYVASRPSGATPAGLYDKLLKLPKNFQELAKENGVDVDADIKKFLAQRSGFQKSGVSRNNRMIERHASRNGYFWTSYDFAGNRAKQSLFENPLGPGGTNGFSHDGGESIFSLPNGFQAYYLNNAKGDPLAIGPTNIVQDPTSKDLTVTNGISCMGCHDQGMRKAKDEVRAIVVQSKTFPKETREQVEALYPPTEKMDQVIAGDAKRFADAMNRAGLDPALKLNGVEMVTALMKRYENDLDINLAAAELGLSPKDFVEAGRDADKKFRTLVRRLEQGSIPRDQFEVNFAALSGDITDDEVVNLGGDAPAAAGGAPAAAGGAPAAAGGAPAAAGGAPAAAGGAPAAAGGAPAGGPGGPGKQPQVAKASVTDIAITSDKDVYRQNELAIFTVVSAKDCFLTVTDIDEKGEGTVLFPNKFVTNNRIKANVEIVLPPPGAPFQYRLKDQGAETVTAVCSDVNQAVDGIKHDFNKQAFTAVPNYSRSIAVEAAKPAVVAQGGPGPVPPKGAAPGAPPAPGKRELFRTAIKIKVE